MSSFSICFETDTTIISSSKSSNKDTNNITSGACGACGDDSLPNKDAFTQSNILNLKIRIIPNTMIENVQEHYKITYPHIKLWQFDINDSLGYDCEKLVCILLFINGVYGLHFMCTINTLDKQKHYILDTVIPKYKLYNHKNNNYPDNDKYVLLINTFNSNGSTNTSVYEPIMSF
jgi:hypothetical protein